MQRAPHYDDVTREVAEFLGTRLDVARHRRNPSGGPPRRPGDRVRQDDGAQPRAARAPLPISKPRWGRRSSSVRRARRFSDAHRRRPSGRPRRRDARDHGVVVHPGRTNRAGPRRRDIGARRASARRDEPRHPRWSRGMTLRGAGRRACSPGSSAGSSRIGSPRRASRWVAAAQSPQGAGARSS